jgi:hypothetical protein
MMWSRDGSQIYHVYVYKFGYKTSPRFILRGILGVNLFKLCRQFSVVLFHINMHGALRLKSIGRFRHFHERRWSRAKEKSRNFSRVFL